MDVDIEAGAFTGNDTIFVTATRVGGFPEDNGSFVVPPPILVADDNGDDYDPNWVGYLGNAFAIAAGASAGPNGPVGFAHWDVTSNGANAIGSLNILALGGEGSTSATTLTMHDDGSNTMVYATSISDSRSTDWENLNNINLSGTSGFVTLTGAETDAQEQLDLVLRWARGQQGSVPVLRRRRVADIRHWADNGRGRHGKQHVRLLGARRSGTDFSTIFAPQGGISVEFRRRCMARTGNSEIAFNNDVLTEEGAAGGGNVVIPLTTSASWMIPAPRSSSSPRRKRVALDRSQ